MSVTPPHIHLSGICGTAMASLAGLLQLQGHRITGSDKAAYPPMSDLLRGLGIPILEPYAESNLDPAPDLVVIGNALSRGNPEVERVLDQRIPFISMAALLHDEFLTGRESLVIAGTHGKTTTTSMLAWIYQFASQQNPALEPSFLIGGVAENFGSSFQLNPTRTFIIEGDEYDTAFFDKGPKFLHYFPDALILTHVEFDHADIYADLDAVKTAFKRLVNLVPRRGLIVAYDGSDNVTECVASALCRVERYGFSEPADWQLRNLRHEDGLTALGSLARRRALGRARHAIGRRAQRPQRHRRRRSRLSVRASRKERSSPRWPASKASSAASKSAPKSPASPSSTTSPTTPPPFAKPSAPSAPSIRIRASGPFSSRAPTRFAAKFSKPISSTACASPTASSSPASTSSSASPTTSASIPKTSSTRSTPPERWPSSAPMPTPSSTHRAPLTSGDVVAILSNGGFDGIYEKLPTRLRTLHPAAAPGKTHA